MVDYINKWPTLALLVLPIFLSGCGSPSVFHGYPSQIGEVQADLALGNYAQARGYLENKVKSSDGLLYTQELGRVGEFEGDLDASNADYERAARMIDGEWEEASVTVGSVASTAGALVLNDNVIPYSGKGYEKIFIHTFKALNYLEKGDLEGAAVEMRRADNDQRVATLIHEREVERAKTRADSDGIPSRVGADAMESVLHSMHTTLSQVKNSFENAYTHYLSGLVWEMNGEPDNAFISYEKAYEVFPSNPYVGGNLLRLSQKLRYTDRLKQFKGAFSGLDMPAMASNEGRVVILLEDGYVPPKQEINIPVFWTKRTYTVALPYYGRTWSNPYTWRVSVDGQYQGETAPICYVSAMAAKDLQERYFGIVVRQLGRLILKDQMQKEADGENTWLGLASSIFSIISERADLRSWLTLPDNVQVADFIVPAGDRSVQLGGNYGDATTVTVPVEAGKISIVRVLNPDRQLQVRVLAQPQR